MVSWGFTNLDEQLNQNTGVIAVLEMTLEYLLPSRRLRQLSADEVSARLGKIDLDSPGEARAFL